MVHYLPHGIAWARGAHLDARFRLLRQLSPGIVEGMDFWMLKRQRFFPKVQMLPEKTVSLVADGHGNYYHWMLDVLPRLAAFDPDCLSSQRYLVMHRHPFQQQTLELLQIPVQSCTDAEGIRFYSAPEMLVPTGPTGLSRENVRFVRHLLLERTGLAAASPPRDRIYISRQKANSRRLLDEEKLWPILKRHGFRTCHPEELSLRQQMLLFQGAEIILAPHGAAWTNLIFARPGTLALEIIPEGFEAAHPAPFFLYRHLAEACGVRHERIVAPSSRTGYPLAGDLKLTPAALEEALARYA